MHAIGGIYVVLEQHRYAEQWPLGAVLGVEPARDRRRIGIDFEYRAQGGPAPVDGCDTCAVTPHKRADGRSPGGELVLSLGDVLLAGWRSLAGGRRGVPRRAPKK